MNNLLALDCFLSHFGRRYQVGRLAVADTGQIAWRYHAEILDTALELAPFSHPLSGETYLQARNINNSPRHGLPGFLADPLPDVWGAQLMQTALRGAGLQNINVLDRLAWQANRAIGGFEFEPVHTTANHEPTNAWDLRQLRQQTQRIVEEQPAEVAAHLQQAGGTAGGAYPKYAVSVGPNNTICSTALSQAEGFRPVILKVPTQSDQYCRIEHSYAQMATTSGIKVPNTQLVMDGDTAWYAIDRFDRHGEGFQLKQHQSSLAGLLDRDFDSQPTSAEEALAVCRQLTARQADVEELFRRIVFNWLAHNCDDHAKNFSFQLDQQGEWRLAPWYDGAWCLSDSGHAMAIDGWRIASPSLQRYLKLGKSAGIRRAAAICEQVISSLSAWPELASNNGVPVAMIEQVQQQVTLNLPK